MDLVNKEAALILEEENLTKTNLVRMIDDIFNDQDKYKKIKDNVKALGISDSSSRIYEVLKDMIMDDKKFY